MDPISKSSPTGTQLATVGTKRAGMLTRKQAAKAIDCSIRTLRRREGVDVHPIVDEKGQYWYDRTEIERLAAGDETDGGLTTGQLTEGQIAAGAFGMFRAGNTPTQVVEALALPPDLVRRLYEQWVELEHGFCVMGPDLLELRRLLGEPLRAAGRLNAFVRFLMRQHRQLEQFTYPCMHCEGEVQARAEREWHWLLEAGALNNWGHEKCMEARWK